jgi:NDP-sugar pyrophosphorylase family protein
MELKAILIQGGSPQNAEMWTEQALSSIDVLGKPVVDHIADRLQRAGVDSITLVTSFSTSRKPRRGMNVVNSAPDQLWRSAETVFNLYAQAGAEIVLALRIGPYVEIDLDSLLHFHHERKNRITRVIGKDRESLDFAVIDASRRNDAAYLFRTQLQQTRLPAEEFEFRGYCNSLRDISELRRLAQDALMLDCEIRPDGNELKPGVWVGEGANIAKDARLVAPCFIGADAKVHAGAVITRMSCVERNAEVDLGTMVENSSILPLSYIGPGLDIAHSIVGYSKVANLLRNATVAICDPKLTAELSSSAFVRRVGGFAETLARAATAVVGSFTSKHAAPQVDTANVEPAPAAEKTRAVAKAS